MTRAQLERVLGVVVRQIGELVGRFSPSFHFIAVVWDTPDNEQMPVSRRISTIPPELIDGALAILTDESRRSGPTEVILRDDLGTRN